MCILFRNRFDQICAIGSPTILETFTEYTVEIGLFVRVGTTEGLNILTTYRQEGFRSQNVLQQSILETYTTGNRHFDGSICFLYRTCLI